MINRQRTEIPSRGCEPLNHGGVYLRNSYKMVLFILVKKGNSLSMSLIYNLYFGS